MVAVDVDGTLLDSRGEVTPPVAAAVRDASAGAVKIVLASGRPPIAMQTLLHHLEIASPFIASAGALVAESGSGAILLHSPLSPQTTVQVVQIARSHSLPVFIEEPERVMGEAEPEMAKRIGERFGYKMTVVADVLCATSGTPTKIFLHASPGLLHAIEREIIQARLPVHLGYPFPDYIEINRVDVNKASAVEYLAGYFGIPMERVMVIGDSENDVSMFRVAGLAVAMGNAPAQVKAEAQVVAPTNDEGGVAWALCGLL